MQPDTREIERDDLIAALKREGLNASRHKLLRWVDAGLLPRPRREGLGRGKGSRSYYPRIAFLQARTLHRLLADKRNLDDVGWGLWALGFPLTDWAQTLLLDELRDTIGLMRLEAKRMREGRSGIAEAAARKRPPQDFRDLRKMVRASAAPKVLRMGLELQLGDLHAENYTANEWTLFQDVGVYQSFPHLLDDPDLPEPEEFAPPLEVWSSQVNLFSVRDALRSVEKPLLEKYRNEFQWLSVKFASPEERERTIMDRDDFITYFKFRHVDSDGEVGITVLMRGCGLDRPPQSQLQRWLAGLQRLQHRDAT